MGLLWAFEGCERFTYLPTAQEPGEGPGRVIADSAAKPAEALGQPWCWQAFLITRKQRAEAFLTRVLPPGSLDRLAPSPRRSPTVTPTFDSPTAEVLTLTESKLP
jgi:hypothetical protein